MYQQLRLAVVVPAFREAALLPRTLSTMPDFVDEVVVVDDASPDHTAALLASWPDTRLSVV